MNSEEKQISKNEEASSGRLEQLVMLRGKIGISQAELARRTGLSPAAISLLEKGAREPVLSTAIAISKALCISLDILAGLIEPRPDDIRLELAELKLKMKSIQTLST